METVLKPMDLLAAVNHWRALNDLASAPAGLIDSQLTDSWFTVCCTVLLRLSRYRPLRIRGRPSSSLEKTRY